MTEALKPPMPYAGGKQRVAETIVGLMPAHEHYVEPFAGGLSVLLAKPPSLFETANDIDGDIVTFWTVLRERPDELERWCALTLHARGVYDGCRRAYDGDDDLVRAWRVWVTLTQGRGARSDGVSGWRNHIGRASKTPITRYLKGYVARIAPAAERLLAVSWENRPALDVIHIYDREGTLFYVDPPYLAATRNRALYRHEMGEQAEHEELLDTLTACRSSVMLSGYRTDLYDRCLAGWRRVDMPATCMTGAPRVESLWMNYDPSQEALPW